MIPLLVYGAAAIMVVLVVALAVCCSRKRDW
jgi:hypothetical protein